MDLKEISSQLQAEKAKIVKELVAQAIDEGISSEVILKDGLMAGMNVVGEKFKNNESSVERFFLWYHYFLNCIAYCFGLKPT